MRTRLSKSYGRCYVVLQNLVILLTLAFASVDALGQCYNWPGCEYLRHVVTPYTWSDSTSYIRYKVSTDRNGNIIIPDAKSAAGTWNAARCNSKKTGFPFLVYGGTTNIEAGRGSENIIGFAYVDGDGGKLAFADVIKNRSNTIIQAHVRLDYYHDHDPHSDWDRPRPRADIGHCLLDTITHELGHWVQLNDVHSDLRCRPPNPICMDYYFYTMHGCPEKDEHRRETLHDADIDATWSMYNGANLAPQAQVFQRSQHTASVLKTQLLNNYPDPFNPDTWIPFELAEGSDIVIDIHDSNGVHVRSLDLGRHTKGRYFDRMKAAHWDGKDDYGQTVASGVYFYTLHAGSVSDTRKLVILK